MSSSCQAQRALDVLATCSNQPMQLQPAPSAKGMLMIVNLPFFLLERTFGC
jgi:hypothetical protein